MVRAGRGWAAGAVAGVVLALGAPAGAQAAALVTAPCSAAVTGTKTVPIQGSGFTPNSFVRLQADGQAFGSVQTDAAGSFADVFLAPSFSSINRTRQTFDVTATDAAGVAAASPLRVTRVGAALPRNARPGSRVRMRAFGFVPGQVVYLHIRRGGRTLGSYKVGTAVAPCGTASRRLRYMPLRTYRTGTYDYEFQQSRRFDASKPRVQLKISIFRTVRQG